MIGVIPYSPLFICLSINFVNKTFGIGLPRSENVKSSLTIKLQSIFIFPIFDSLPLRIAFSLFMYLNRKI